MQGNFHKKTSECRQKTSGTQKSSPLSSKGDVLSTVLYRWRSLEATVKIRLKTRSRRLSPNPENTRELLTPGNINRQELIKCIHTYTETKHHPRANKFQSKTYHTNSPATQEHSPELQYTGCPKLLQTHWHLITHYWTLHCTPERRNPAPPTRTWTQASLTRKPWQATRTTPPTVRKRHNKENSTNCQNTERTPQTQQFKQDEETYKLNKQGDDTAWTYSFSYLEPVCCSMSSSNWNWTFFFFL